MIQSLSRRVLIFALLLVSSVANAKTPDCTGPDRWPAAMAFGYLKDVGLIDNENLDFTKTKSIRLASEKKGKDLYRQLHLVTFTEKSGRTIEVITSNDASNVECSMSGVQVFVISKKLGDSK